MKLKSINEYTLFLEAWFLLHVSRLIILFLPFKKIVASLGILNQESINENNDLLVAENIKKAIQRASRHSLHPSKCYDQALAGKFMLKWRRLPSTIYFGLSMNNKSNLIAHAWLRFGNNIITGEKGMEDFTIVAFYGDPYNYNSNRNITSQS